MICIALQFKLCANKMIQDFNSAICQISLKFCSAATRSQASSAVRPAYVASLPRLVRYMNRSLRHQTHRLSRRVERKTSAHCTHSLAGYMVVPHGKVKTLLLLLIVDDRSASLSISRVCY